MRRICIIASLVCSAGCSMFVDNLVSSAGSSAGSQVGSAAGNRAGAAAVEGAGGSGASASGAPAGGAYGGGMAMSPQATAFYTQYIFGMAFGSGGYAISPIDYKPGQYTRWNISGGDGKGATLERAFLATDADGNQWWKVKFIGEKGEATIFEALLSPKDQKMLRLRGKFPNDAEGKEMAVSENAYYAPPQHLSKQSIEGAVVGTETVSVPAGSFTARHVVFGGMGASHEWWISEKVPGGTVKQATQGQNSGGNGYELVLAAYGDNAVSELGSH